MAVISQGYISGFPQIKPHPKARYSKLSTPNAWERGIEQTMRLKNTGHSGEQSGLRIKAPADCAIPYQYPLLRIRDALTRLFASGDALLKRGVVQQAALTWQIVCPAAEPGHGAGTGGICTRGSCATVPLVPQCSVVFACYEQVGCAAGEKWRKFYGKRYVVFDFDRTGYSTTTKNAPRGEGGAFVCLTEDTFSGQDAPT